TARHPAVGDEGDRFAEPFPPGGVDRALEWPGVTVVVLGCDDDEAVRGLAPSPEIDHGRAVPVLDLQGGDVHSVCFHTFMGADVVEEPACHSRPGAAVTITAQDHRDPQVVHEEGPCGVWEYAPTLEPQVMLRSIRVSAPERGRGRERHPARWRRKVPRIRSTPTPLRRNSSPGAP